MSGWTSSPSPIHVVTKRFNTLGLLNSGVTPTYPAAEE